MAHQLDRDAHRVITQLGEADDGVSVVQLAEQVELDQSKVMAICQGFAEEGWVALQEESFVELSATPEGEAWMETGEPLLERRIAEHLKAVDASQSTPEIASALEIAPQEVGKVLRLVLGKGYARKDGKALAWSDADLDATTTDEELLAQLRDADGVLRLPESKAEANDIASAIKTLRSRGYVKTKDRTQRNVHLLDAGRKALDKGVEVVEQVNQLTEEMLLSGEWENVTFRPYDVHLDTTSVHPGKPHPLRRVLEETRQAFLHMGFAEIRGGYVESAFWDFDALFQPQDHPAREMQDTFYCERPGLFSLPKEELVEVIRRTHEEGGDTGSTGWRYRWSEDKAKQVVLRTHTTAVTVAACHNDPTPPQKLFTVGRVFRRETIDYKHLPEFHQVDGIIIDESASFANLLGTLTAFYRQMGFEAVKFRPAFFPYTEPSVEVFVRMPGRKEWFELGGAGVFRPEVTRPAGVKVPVLAWGLGLERLAMIRYQIEDIRELYLSHLDWLRNNPLSS